MMLWGALKLARSADLFLVPVARYGFVEQRGSVLRFGPGASAHEIVTIACRRLLARRGKHNEADVIKMVRSKGYDYVPRAWTVMQAC